MNEQQYSPTGFKLLPPAVKNLLIINGLFFLATISLDKIGIDLERMFGLYYVGSPYFRPYQFVTYMFVHANFTHIFFNLFSLWMFGYLLENVWGSKRFLIFYLFCGIGAAITQIFVQWWSFSSLETAVAVYNNAPGIDSFVNFVNHYPPHTSQLLEQLKSFLSEWNSNPLNEHYLILSKDNINQLYVDQISVPTIGASGAVYGILLAFGMMFPNMLVYFYFLVPIKAKWVVIGFFLIELISGLRNNPTDNVAHFAHLGGMFFGLLLILYWKKRPFSKKPQF
jgi:membrane associated rhomboid family serine protease